MVDTGKRMMQVFFEPSGNHGCGIAIASNRNYVVVAIRAADGTGEVLSFDNPEDYASMLGHLELAGKVAFDESTSVESSSE